MLPSNHTTIGAYSLERKERYDIIIIGKEWYIFVLQGSRDFLPCHLFSTCRVCVSHNVVLGQLVVVDKYIGFVVVDSHVQRIGLEP